MTIFESRLASIAVTVTFFLSTFALSSRAFTLYPGRGYQASQRSSRRLARQPIDDSDDDCSRSSTAGASSSSSVVPNENNSMNPLSRRLFASQVAGTAGGLLFLPGIALAGIDVSSLKTAPVEGDASGAATRLKQLQMMQQSGNLSSYVSGPIILESGVSYTDVKAGRDGSRTVRRGSNVGAEVTIRCKSFATANEPRGPIYFSTKQDTDFEEELAWKIGSGDLPKGLEEGMMGMKLNASRRIEVPSQQIFAARNAGQLPEATTEEGKRRYEDLFKAGDATLIFEVYVTGINQGDNRI